MKKKLIVTGILTANVLALLLIVFTWLLIGLTGRHGEGGGSDYTFVFVASDFVLIPFLMGALMAYLWNDLKLSASEAVGYSFLSLVVSYLICTIILREGVICLLMALPLVTLFQWSGYMIGKALANRNNRRLNATLAPLFLLLVTANVLATQGYDSQITDTIVIRASPQKVWSYIAGYPAITAPPDYWLWKIGLPAPVQSIADAEKVGAQRKCILTGNVTLEECITQVIPAKELSFDITTQPKDPEIIGHFVLHKGQFLLQDNGDGTTTLTGSSWYTLHVHPACYYDLWAQDIVRRVHLRVMRHIKALAEQASP